MSESVPCLLSACPVSLSYCWMCEFADNLSTLRGPLYLLTKTNKRLQFFLQLSFYALASASDQTTVWSGRSVQPFQSCPVLSSPAQPSPAHYIFKNARTLVRKTVSLDVNLSLCCMSSECCTSSSSSSNSSCSCRLASGDCCVLCRYFRYLLNASG